MLSVGTPVPRHDKPHQVCLVVINKARSVECRTARRERIKNNVNLDLSVYYANNNTKNIYRNLIATACFHFVTKNNIIIIMYLVPILKYYDL